MNQPCYRCDSPYVWADGLCYHCYTDLIFEEIYAYDHRIFIYEEEVKEVAQFSDKPHIGAWSFPSSKGSTVYETILYADGSTSCGCQGWIILRKDKLGNPKPRECKHTKRIDEFRYRIIAGLATPETYGGVSAGSAVAVKPSPKTPTVTTNNTHNRLARMVVRDED